MLSMTPVSTRVHWPGCDWVHDSAMFDQVEDDLSPVLEWSWRLKTDIKVVLGSDS